VNFVHTAHFVLIFTVCWLLYLFVSRRELMLSSQFLKNAGLAFGVAALLALPFFVPYSISEINGSMHFIVSGGASQFTTTPVSFLVPSHRHPLIQALGLRDEISELLAPMAVESWAYVGLLPLFLAVWGLLKNRAKAGFWAVYAVVSIVLSMGPFLRIGRNLVVIDRIDGIDVLLPLPYVLLRVIPLFKMGRTPGRIAIGTPLALSVMVSLGVVRVEAWMKRFRGKWMWLVIPLCTLVILCEYCVAWPYPCAAAPVPDFYKQVSEEEGNFSIIDYPLNTATSRRALSLNQALYYQTVHEKPIAGGRVWRLNADAVGKIVLMNNLVAPDDQAVPDIFVGKRSDREKVEWLSELRFRYLVLHKYPEGNLNQNRRSTQTVETEKRYFSTLFSEPIYEDELIAVFLVPSTDGFSTETQPLAVPTDGWNHTEGGSEVDVFRWMEQEGSLLVQSPAADTYRLSFTAHAYDHPREINLLVNGKTVYTTTVDTERKFLTPAFTLQEGTNSLTFRAAQPCDSPADVFPGSRDTRSLSVSLSQMAWADDVPVYYDPDEQTQFGEYFRLLGYDVDRTEIEQGDTVHLKLYWEVLKRPDHDYTVFTHIWDSHRGLAGQEDSEPLDGYYHTTWFGAGEIIEDTFSIVVRDDAAPGTYGLQIGWYEWMSGERLLLAQDPARTVLPVGDIEIETKDE